MDKTISILLSYQPFMACLVQRCKLRWTDKCPTAGVRILPAGVIELLVNPEFFYLQSEAARVGLLWHEMYHLIAGHIEGSYGLDPQTANIAMDESINQLIPQRFLPKKAILPEYFRHEKNKSFEFYYNLHKKRTDGAKYQQPKKYEGGVDDEQNKKDLKEQIKKALDKQKELQDQQEQLQDKQEEQSDKGQQSKENTPDQQSKTSESQKGLAKSEDKLEDKQDELSEKMQDNGLQEDAETSDDLTDRQKDLRKRMEKMNEDLKQNPSSDPDMQKQQQEMKDLQDQQGNAQKELEEALNKLEEINKQQAQRKQGQGKGKPGQGGQPGEPGEGGEGQGQGQGEAGDEDAPQVMDNHDMWHTSPASAEEQKMSLGNVLSQAVADAERQFGYNSVPMELRQMMEKAMQKPKIKWSTIVKNYFGRCLVNDQYYSRKKPNRKFGYLAPGKAQKFGPKIIVAVDCSGSVADSEYMEFMTEFQGIAGEIAEKVEVIFFDTKVFEQKLMLDANMKKIPPRPLAGGTDFQCVIDYAKDRKPDLLIYLTDGACNVPEKPKYPVLWVICGGRDNPALFGKRVLLELDNNRQNTKVLGE